MLDTCSLRFTETARREKNVYIERFGCVYTIGQPVLYLVGSSDCKYLDSNSDLMCRFTCDLASVF